jgi:hypothetical protein
MVGTFINNHMEKTQYSPEVLQRVKELMKNNIKLKKFNLPTEKDMELEKYKTAYERYLKEREEFLLDYSVKYEWKNEYSIQDKGPITLEQFVGYLKDDVAFADKWKINMN